MNTFFEHLKKTNILSRKGINIPTIQSLSTTKVIDLAEELNALMESSADNSSRSIFTHTTSSQMSGSRDLCDSLNCRLSRIDQLARFALLYSDRVYINNFFSDYEHFKDADTQQQKPEITRLFYEDVYLTVQYKPLFEKGFLAFFNPPTHICEECLSRSFLGIDAEVTIEKSCWWSKQHLSR
jgi:hypothetical protein